MANVLVDPEGTIDKKDGNSGLSAYIMERVDEWEDYRNTNFKAKWEEYYRLWRGIWSSADRSRQSERSRLISPALQQAVEMAVAELEEATFGKGVWFGIADDILDQDKNDMQAIAQLLKEDLEKDGVPAAVSEVFLNAALYGTGIGKLVVEEGTEVSVGEVLVSEFSDVTEGVGDTKDVINIPLIPVSPEEFVIDPSATDIKTAHGMAQVMDVPLHIIQSKQEAGVYEDVDLGSYPDDMDLSAKEESKTISTDGKVRIVEYHGLVPRYLIPIELDEDEEFEDLGIDPIDGEFIDETLVEVIVTLANDGILLQAKENNMMMSDRCFMAFPYDKIPNRFWGRGIAEKGYNMQKAIDAELRARMDAMALTIHPMIAADATRLPRGFDLSVRAGKSLLTNGDPNTILKPFNFGGVDANTFTQSGDLERQLQNATGSMDAASPIAMNARNATASGMSMMQGGAIKRSKRTLANIERYFISPLIHKAAWRRMQFDTTRYQVKDVKFVAYGTMGIMAREIEQQQLSQLLSTVPPDSPAYWMLIKSIYENSSISSKAEMLQLVDQLLQKTLQPEPDPMIEIKKQELELLRQDKSMSLRIEMSRAETERARVKLLAKSLPYDIAVKEAKAMLDVASAEAKEVGVQLDVYQTKVDSLVDKSTGDIDGAGT